MAEKKKITLQEILAGNKSKTKIGQYQESTGGGTPMKRGEKIDYVANSAKDAQSYRAQHPGELVRVKQPRDEDGQFTYNSANKKPLEYGPSRGKTIPPFLEGTKITFAKKSGRATLIGEDGRRFVLSDNIKSKDDFVKQFMEYREGEGFGDIGDTESIVKGKGGVTKTKVIEMGRKEFLDGYKAHIEKSLQYFKSKSIKHDFKPKTPSAPSSQPKSSPKIHGTLQESNGGKKVDYSLAKSNPKQFAEKYAVQLNKIAEIAKNGGFEDLDIESVVSSLAEGEFTSFGQIEMALKDALKEE